MGTFRPSLFFAVVILLNALSGCVSDQAEGSGNESGNNEHFEELSLQLNQSKKQLEEINN